MLPVRITGAYEHERRKAKAFQGPTTSLLCDTLFNKLYLVVCLQYSRLSHMQAGRYITSTGLHYI